MNKSSSSIFSTSGRRSLVAAFTLMAGVGTQALTSSEAAAQEENATESRSAASLTCDITGCNSSPTPLPDNFFGGDTWDPCHGHGFWYTAHFDFEWGYDFLYMNGKTYSGRNRWITDRAEYGFHVSASTDYVVQSGGLYSLTAECDPYLHCDNGGCQVLPDPVVDNFDDTVLWDPCDGGPFRWIATIDFEHGTDWMEVGGEVFSTTGTFVRDEWGPVEVSVHMVAGDNTQGIQWMVPIECLPKP